MSNKKNNPVLRFRINKQYYLYSVYADKQFRESGIPKFLGIGTFIGFRTVIWQEPKFKFKKQIFRLENGTILTRHIDCVAYRNIITNEKANN